MSKYICKVQLIKNGQVLDFNFNENQYQQFYRELNNPDMLFIQVGKEIETNVNIVLSRKVLEETTITMEYIENDI